MNHNISLLEAGEVEHSFVRHLSEHLHVKLLTEATEMRNPGRQALTGTANLVRNVSIQRI
jgi:hypothetical protein